MGKLLGLQEYTGNEFIKSVTPRDVVSQWNGVAEIGSCDKPIVLSLPRKKFADGASIANLQELWKSGQLESVAGRGVALISSADTAEALFDTIGTARWLRHFGATEVMAIFKRLYGLRQDDVFSDKETMDVKLETVTAFDAIGFVADATDFSGRRLIGRTFIIEAHSNNVFQYGSIKNMPTAGGSCYQYMGESLGLKERVTPEWVVLGPDAGGHKTSSLFAQWLGIEEVGFEKSRDRVTGKVHLVNVERSLAGLKGKKVGLFFDDELQTGNTLKLVTDAANKALDEFIVLAAHANFSETTAENLNHPKISLVAVTDGMISKYMINRLPNGVPVQVLPLDESLGRVAEQLWRGDLRQQLPDGWQLDPWFNW